MKTTSEDTLASLDVVSMYTNIPVKKALDCVNIFLRKHPEILEGSTLSIGAVMAVMDVCMSSTYFSFQGKFYEQVRGVPMGQPLSVPVANIFMHWVETTILDTIPLEPKFWKRFLDDIYLVWRLGQEKLLEFLTLVNNVCELKFTLENEKDGELPFLDILTKRQGNKVGRDLYRKETNSGIILNYNSNHQFKLKIGILKSLTLRSLRITDENHRMIELERLADHFLKNDYPEALIARIVIQTLTNFLKPEGYTRSPKPEDDRPVLVLTASNLGLKIRPIASKFGIRTVLSQSCTLGTTLPNQMERSDPLMTSGVYRVPCGECGLAYYGQTMRPIKVRLGEHRTACKYRHLDKSDIARHCEDTGHRINWEGSHRLAICDRRRTDRLIRESIEIKSHADVMNTTAVEKSLGPIFNTILTNRKRLFVEENEPLPRSKRPRY